MKQFKKHKLLTCMLAVLLFFGSYKTLQAFVVGEETTIVYNAQGEQIGTLSEVTPVLEGKSYFLDEYNDNEKVYMEFFFQENLVAVFKRFREGFPEENFNGALGGGHRMLDSIKLANQNFSIAYQNMVHYNIEDFKKQYSQSFTEDILDNEIIINNVVAEKLNLKIGQEIYCDDLKENLIIKDIISPNNTTNINQEFYQKYFLDIPLVFGGGNLYEKFNNDNGKIGTGDLEDNIGQRMMQGAYYFENKSDAEAFLNRVMEAIDKQEIK